jgi:hypothetical protein
MLLSFRPWVVANKITLAVVEPSSAAPAGKCRKHGDFAGVRGEARTRPEGPENARGTKRGAHGSHHYTSRLCLCTVSTNRRGCTCGLYLRHPGLFWKPLVMHYFFTCGKAVPGERFELPTNGLQNRCSTTELTRQVNDLAFSCSPNWHRIGTAGKQRKV